MILAGGPGTRLRPLTEKMPKAMIPIAGKPFLEHQINLLKNNSVSDIVLCTGYMGEMIHGYFGNGGSLGVSIRYSDDGDRLLGTAGALKSAHNLLHEEFFVTFCDAYPILDYHAIRDAFLASNKAGLMVVQQNFNRYDASNTVVKDGIVTLYSKTSRTKEMSYVEFGVTFLKRSTLDLIPASFPVDLEELYGKLILQKEMAAFVVDQRIYEIGSCQGLKEFRELFESGKLEL